MQPAYSTASADWAVQFFFAITPRFTQTGVVVPVKDSSMDQIELLNHLLYLKQFDWVQTID